MSKKVGRKCPECGGDLVIRKATTATTSVIDHDGVERRVREKRYPAFIGCSNYYKKGCTYTEELE